MQPTLASRHISSLPAAGDSHSARPGGGRSLIPLGNVCRDIGVHLGLQRLGQHPPGAFPHDLIDQRRRAILPAYRLSRRQGLR